MKLIAVLDLMQGRVVHARRGERGAYRPVASGLAPSAEPLAVAAALLDLFSFDALYVADLDAILGRGDHFAVLGALRRCFPGLEIWVDAGFRDPAALAAFLSAGLGTPILGSEVQRDVELIAGARGCGAVLSLDFRGGAFLGPPELLERTDLWPARVIALDLARVGSGRGPDLDLLADIGRRAPAAEICAGGGVRSVEDLESLRAAGAAAVLLASALHEGGLVRGDLERIRRG